MTQLQIEKNIVFDTYCGEINYSTFNLENIDNQFVISKTKEEKILSKFGDFIWDFSPYAPIHITHKINFQKKFNNDLIAITEAKKLVFIALVFGSGKRSSVISVSTLINLFNGFVTPFIYFIKQHHSSSKKARIGFPAAI